MDTGALNGQAARSTKREAGRTGCDGGTPPLHRGGRPCGHGDQGYGAGLTAGCGAGGGFGSGFGAGLTARGGGGFGSGFGAGFTARGGGG